MLWSNAGISTNVENIKIIFNIEDRIFLDSLNLSEFIINYNLEIKNTKITPIIGLSLHNFGYKTETRAYYGFDTKYVRLLLENRFSNNELKFRLRSKIQYTYKIYDWLYLKAYEELFWVNKFDHNRFFLGTRYKIKNVMVDIGYLSYYKNVNHNSILIKLDYNLK